MTHMTTREMELVRKFRSRVEERLHVHAMIVFGSRARGDADDDSDLDVLVVLEEPESREIRRFVSECAFEVDLDNDFVISPIVFSRERWENGPERVGPLALAIREEGIPV